MENKLKNLFDFQRFEQNEDLAKIIEEATGSFAAELSENDLDMINAAGNSSDNFKDPNAKNLFDSLNDKKK